MKVVFDTSGFINLCDFRCFEEIYTVPEVVEEVKKVMTKVKFSALPVKIFPPSFKFLKQVENLTKKLKIEEKLSLADKNVLALALELKLPLLSDDSLVKKVGKSLGIEIVESRKKLKIKKESYSQSSKISSTLGILSFLLI